MKRICAAGRGFCAERGELGLQVLDGLHRLQEHRQQDRLEGHGPGGVTGDGGVMPGGGKEPVEGDPVLHPERAAKRGPQVLLALDELRHRGNGAAHLRSAPHPPPRPPPPRPPPPPPPAPLPPPPPPPPPP